MFYVHWESALILVSPLRLKYNMLIHLQQSTHSSITASFQGALVCSALLALAYIFPWWPRTRQHVYVKLKAPMDSGSGTNKASCSMFSRFVNLQRTQIANTYTLSSTSIWNFYSSSLTLNVAGFLQTIPLNKPSWTAFNAYLSHRRGQRENPSPNITTITSNYGPHKAHPPTNDSKTIVLSLTH